MTDLTNEKLSALERAAKAATPGEWAARPKDEERGRRWTVDGPDINDDFMRGEDAEFIAAADPPTVLALVEEVRRLRKWLRLLSLEFEEGHAYTDIESSVRNALSGESCPEWFETWWRYHVGEPVLEETDDD